MTEFKETAGNLNTPADVQGSLSPAERAAAEALSKVATANGFRLREIRGPMARAVVAAVRRAEREGAGKTAAELFTMAESEYYMGTRHYPRTEGRERQADRAVLRAVTFDRMARNIEYRAQLRDGGDR
jgi:hypothetical protein